MVELEEVVSKLLDDPATEPIASEIGGASGLFLFIRWRIIWESLTVHLR